MEIDEIWIFFYDQHGTKLENSDKLLFSLEQSRQIYSVKKVTSTSFWIIRGWKFSFCEIFMKIELQKWRVNILKGRSVVKRRFCFASLGSHKIWNFTFSIPITSFHTKTHEDEPVDINSYLHHHFMKKFYVSLNYWECFHRASVKDESLKRVRRDKKNVYGLKIWL